MPADNSIHLIASARQRHELTRSKTVQALRELARTGGTITFEAVARAAGVSRSWLYSQPDLRDDIQRLRETTRPRPGSAVPQAQRVSDASLKQRLEEAQIRIRDLTEDNHRLRRQPAQALGEQRTQRTAPTTRRGSATIGPC